MKTLSLDELFLLTSTLESKAKTGVP